MEHNPRELPTELEIQMRRNAPKLPPDLRRKTLEACSAPKARPPEPAQIPAVAPTPQSGARWADSRVVRQKRQRWYLMGICAAQLTAASLIVVQSATISAGGNQTVTASLLAGAANFVSFFSNIFK